MSSLAAFVGRSYSAYVAGQRVCGGSVARRLVHRSPRRTSKWGRLRRDVRILKLTLTHSHEDLVTEWATRTMGNKRPQVIEEQAALLARNYPSRNRPDHGRSRLQYVAARAEALLGRPAFSLARAEEALGRIVEAERQERPKNDLQ